MEVDRGGGPSMPRDPDQGVLSLRRSSVNVPVSQRSHGVERPTRDVEWRECVDPSGVVQSDRRVPEGTWGDSEQTLDTSKLPASSSHPAVIQQSHRDSGR
ncbi:hypothetical protein DPEC_G00110930 [Dallia pectoralis]|uniref:Uncharacterized protein n=1 Tax=Dallia pectoralis TaxID=75939 RepID=A0ACC2GSZ1_DALPE|nr:hypothetical protein DPEC_G00110930 [Dallia pectoralis]